MSSPAPSRWSWRVRQIRENFDAAFAMPATVPRETTRMLLLTVAGEACALPMHECSLVLRATGIARLPSRNPSFRGLTTVRGATLPVYDMAVRLGMAQPDQRPEWLLVSAGRHRVAFLVDAIDGYAAADEHLEDGALRSIVAVGGRAHRRIELSAMVEDIDHESQHENTTRSER